MADPVEKGPAPKKPEALPAAAPAEGGKIPTPSAEQEAARKKAEEDLKARASEKAETEKRNATNLRKIEGEIIQNKQAAQNILAIKFHWNQDQEHQKETGRVVEEMVEAIMTNKRTEEILSKTGLNSTKNQEILREILIELVGQAAGEMGYLKTRDFAKERILPGLTRLQDIGINHNLSPTELLKRLSKYTQKDDSAPALLKSDNTLNAEAFIALFKTTDFNGLITLFGESLELEKKETDAKKTASITADFSIAIPANIQEMITKKSISFDGTSIVLPDLPLEALREKLKEHVKATVNPKGLSPENRDTVALHMTTPEALGKLKLTPGIIIKINAAGKWETVEATPAAIPNASEVPPADQSTPPTTPTPAEVPPPVAKQETSDETWQRCLLTAADAAKRTDWGAAIGAILEGLLAKLNLGGLGIGVMVMEGFNLYRLTDKESKIAKQAWDMRPEEAQPLANFIAALRRADVPPKNIATFLGDKRTRKILGEKKKNHEDDSWGDMIKECDVATLRKAPTKNQGPTATDLFEAILGKESDAEEKPGAENDDAGGESPGTDATDGTEESSATGKPKVKAKKKSQSNT